MIVQAVKKQRCMKIEPETGIVHYIEEESAEQEERKALSKLALWKHAGYEVMPSFLTSTNEKDENILRQEAEGASSITATRIKSIENSHKGYMECSFLLVLTDLISNQEFLTLQTCSRPSILPRGIPLPPGQVVEIRRQEYKTAQDVISTGIKTARRVVRERRIFAEGILEIRKNWRVLSHSSILATKKHLQHRIVQLDGRERDRMYIDCSYVSSGDKVRTLDEFLVPLDIGPKGPVLGPNERDIICKTLKISLIHRVSGECISSATALKMSNFMKNPGECSAESLEEERSLSSSSMELESSAENYIRNYDIKITSIDGAEANGEIKKLKIEGNSVNSTENADKIDEKIEKKEIKEKENAIDLGLISGITSHCKMRQHDAMSKRLFAYLREAAIEDHDRLIVQAAPKKTLGNDNKNNSNNSSSNNSEMNAKISEMLKITAMENDFALFESELTGSLEVSRVGKGQIELNVSDELSLIVSLEPIDISDRVNNTVNAKKLLKVDENGNIDDEMDIENDVIKEENAKNNDDSNNSNNSSNIDDSKSIEWLSKMFSCSILNAQLLLLDHWRRSLGQIQESALLEQKQLAATAAAATSAVGNRSTGSGGVSIKIEDKKEIKKEKDEPLTSNGTTSASKDSKEHSSAKERSSETHSESLRGVDVRERLVHPVLRMRVRDVGDGLAQSNAGDMPSSSRGIMGMKTDTSSSSHLINNKKTSTLPSGNILFGLLDVIRCGIQKQRVFRILETLKRKSHENFQIDVFYDFFPSKIKEKKETKNNKLLPIKKEIENESDDDEDEHVIKMKKIQNEKLTQELLNSEKAEFFVLLPDSFISILATPKYGFELKSFLRISDFPNELSSESLFSGLVSKQRKSFIDNNNSHSNSINGIISNINTPSNKNKRDNNIDFSMISKNNSFSHCDTIFHPVSLRLDIPRQLSLFLSTVTLGSYFSSVFSEVRGRSSVEATQVSPLLLCLYHQYDVGTRMAMGAGAGGSGGGGNSGVNSHNNIYSNSHNNSHNNSSANLNNNSSNNSNNSSSNNLNNNNNNNDNNRLDLTTMDYGFDDEIEGNGVRKEGLRGLERGFGVPITDDLIAKIKIERIGKIEQNIEQKTVEKALGKGEGNREGNDEDNQDDSGEIIIYIYFARTVDCIAVLTELNNLLISNRIGEIVRDDDRPKTLKLNIDMSGNKGHIRGHDNAHDNGQNVGKNDNEEGTESKDKIEKNEKKDKNLLHYFIESLFFVFPRPPSVFAAFPK